MRFYKSLRMSYPLLHQIERPILIDYINYLIILVSKYILRKIISDNVLRFETMKDHWKSTLRITIIDAR